MALFSKRKHRKKVTEYTEKDYDKAIKDLDREVAEESDFFGKKSFTETASTVTAVIKAVVQGWIRWCFSLRRPKPSNDTPRRIL